MKISQAAIDRPRVIIVATILLLVLSGFAASRIAVQRTPAINKAVVMVAVPYPGAQPTEVEDEITRKIEEALQTLDHVDFISSTSLRGSGVTQIVFEDDVESKQARADVEHLVNQVRRELPLGREVQPMINEIDFDSSPIMLVNLTGPKDFDERTLKFIAEKVQKEIDTIRGVANTQLFGGRKREFHVNVNPDLLAQYGLSLTQVRDALQAFHSKMPGGSLNSSNYDWQVRIESKFVSVDDIRRAVVAEDEGRLIHVEDIAEVRDTFQRLKNFAQIDGFNSATIIVNKESDINSLGTSAQIKETVAKLQDMYPHIKFSTTRDVSRDIRLMFRVLGSSAIFGGMLVLIILAWSMGLRISMLVLLAIPVSTAFALVFLYAFGIPLSNMVIFSYILVLGMVVDGAIIVAENIHRHIEMGKDPVEAAKVGIDEVGIPVIAADLTTVAAFLPMLLVTGIMGDFMGVLPKTVCVALTGSVLVDHFLLPVLASRMYHKRTPEQVREAMEKGEHGHRQLGFFTRRYKRVLEYSLQNRWVVVTTSVLAIVWAGAMLKYGFIGSTFFPGSDRGQFEVVFEMPLGYNIEQTTEAAKVITDPLTELFDSGEIMHFVSAIGSSEALASRLESEPTLGPEFGKIMVELLPTLDRSRSQKEIITELRSKIKPLPGMKYRIEEIQDGPPGGAPVAIRFAGDSLDQLAVLGDQMTNRLRQVRGTIQVRSDYRPDTPELVVEPREGVVGLYGMTDAMVNSAVAMAVLGDTSIELAQEGEDEDITLRLQAEADYQRYPTDIGRLMITSPTGQRATIDELATMKRSAGLFSINRRDRERTLTVSSDLDETIDVIPDEVFAVLRAEILPDMGFRPVRGNSMAFLGEPGTDADGVRAVFTGENEERNKGIADLQWSMLVAVVLISGILVVQFNSFRQAFVVILTVPLSFVGVILGLWICDFDFSLAAFIGLVSLTGIVVNDAIVMVDFANQERRRGLQVDHALVQAGVNRFRAVLLTTATTAGGLLPMLIDISGGGEFWQPLTGAIIFGLLVSSVLTLVVIPTGYSLAYNRIRGQKALA